jgi:hypothetical protein
LDVHPRPLRIAGHSVGDVTALLLDLGYRVPASSPLLTAQTADGGPFEVHLRRE